MADVKPTREPEQLLDVRRAAVLVGRHPETIRRWVWSGRLPARREGTRLLVARSDVEALVGRRERSGLSLAGWADRARRARDAAGTSDSRRTAADLVIEDRADRSRSDDARAGR
jgi:excisionase family DNA binding protein